MPEFIVGDKVRIKMSVTQEQLGILSIPGYIKPGIWGEITGIRETPDAQIDIRIKFISAHWWIPEKYLMKYSDKIDENIKLGDD